MKDQSTCNASKILHSSAIYIQSMKMTRPLRKKLLMIKSVKCFFLHLVQQLQHWSSIGVVYFLYRLYRVAPQNGTVDF